MQQPLILTMLGAFLWSCATPSLPSPNPGASESAVSVNEMLGAGDEHAMQVLVDNNSPSGLQEQGELDGLTLQTQALEACQAASERLDEGDVASAMAHVDQAYAWMLMLADEDESFAQAKQDIRLMVADVIKRIYASQESPQGFSTASRDLGLRLVDNDHVAREIRSFTSIERRAFLQAYQRSGRYRPMILEKLAAAGLPSQLSWLPLVESLFQVSALSHASALGMWQFISSTGLRYGLRRDDYRDERMDPIKSTDAAVGYLADLHRMFGDWEKALAAYNCGENRVQRLQQRSADQYLDFWDLYLLLPDETRRYVPRLIAVLKLVEDPERYGLELPELDAPLEETDVVRIERSVQLSALDTQLGLEPGTLTRLNPSLRHNATPTASFKLRVPAGQGEIAQQAVSHLPVYQPPKPKFAIHRVRSGETLSVIANRYRTSVSLLMRLNNLKSAHRIWPGQKLRIPSRG